MKTFLKRAVWAFALFSVLAAAEPAADIRLVGKTDKSPLSYRPGEEMVFTFTLDAGEAKQGNWKLHYLRRGDDKKTLEGTAPADRPFVFKTSLDRPGFVNVEVILKDENGKVVFSEKLRPNGTRLKRRVIFSAGAAVSPETLKDCGELAGFDAFWARQKERLAAVPFAGKVEKKLVRETKNCRVYAVSLPAPGPRPATGYLSIPKNAKPGSLPVHLIFFGYGINPQRPPAEDPKNFIAFHVNAHGQKLEQSAEYYTAFFKSIGGKGYAYDHKQNQDPETSFFNGMALRDLRAAEYVKTLPEWNRKDLIVKGGSQGGLQTVWVAALDPDVTAAYASIIWLCDLAGAEKKNRCPAMGRVKYFPALEYYDPVFMAKRIKKAKVVIPRAGLGDYTSPPSGIAIFYNNLATPDKTVKWYQGSTHGEIPEKPEIVTWTARAK
ncbi:MAG: acetylxylan esterase [Lentisphaeria bacterium]|nr:acetylxylan esterase [Lentisphaeria bacterium]